MASLVIPAAAITTLFFLLISPTSVVSGGGTVLDIDGEAVINGLTYYILPNKPNAKPLTYTTFTHPSSSSLFITESGTFHADKPTAVTLSSPIPTPNLPLSSPIFINFIGQSPAFCNGPLFWFMTSFGGHTLSLFAHVCGQGGESMDLTIEPAKGVNDMNNVYTLNFCYHINSFDCHAKLELGWLELGGPQDVYLGYNPMDPLHVVFQKFERSSSII